RSVAVLASDQTCTWTANSTLNWVSMNASGIGNGTASYSVASNLATNSRMGNVTVAGRALAIIQPGVKVFLTLSSNNTAPSNFTGPPPIQPSITGLNVQVKDTDGQVLPNFTISLSVSADATKGGHIHNSPAAPSGDIADLSTNPPTPKKLCMTE